MTKYKLGDLIAPEKKSLISGPFGSNISSKYFVEKGIPVIRGNNLNIGYEKFNDSGYVFITKEKAEELDCWAQIDDLIFTAAGTLGQVGIITDNLSYKEFVISNKQIRARLNKKVINVLYAYYWCSSPWIRAKLKNNDKGSTVPLLTLAEIRELPVYLPEDLQKQNRIVNVLESLSKKIALNRRMNAKLEQMAKRLYDYWFVQFDFPNADGKPYKSSGGKMVYSDVLIREIPAGWEAKKLGEIALVKRGTTITEKDTTKGNVKVVAGGIDFSYYHNQSNRKANCITVSGSGENAGFVNFWREPIFASDCSTVQCENDIDTMLCYFALKMQEKRFYRISHKSAQPHIYPKDVAEIPIVVPNEAVKSKISDFFLKSNGKIALIEKETQKLTAMRDRLLPLLMNGQVEVR